MKSNEESNKSMSKSKLPPLTGTVTSDKTNDKKTLTLPETLMSSFQRQPSYVRTDHSTSAWLESTKRRADNFDSDSARVWLNTGFARVDALRRENKPVARSEENKAQVTTASNGLNAIRSLFQPKTNLNVTFSDQNNNSFRKDGQQIGKYKS